MKAIIMREVFVDIPLFNTKQNFLSNKKTPARGGCFLMRLRFVHFDSVRTFRALRDFKSYFVSFTKVGVLDVLKFVRVKEDIFLSFA